MVKRKTDSTNHVKISEKLRWYNAQTGDKKEGVCLVVHGLNLHPSRMEPICTFLQELGMDALLLSLQGHGENFTRNAGQPEESARLQSFKKVTLNSWLAEFKTGYQLAQKRSRENESPLYFVCFSLGGLLGPLCVVERSDVWFDKMVLFAPALVVRKKVYLLKMLSPFPRMVIPSQSGEFYRANRGTPVAAYRVLFTGLAKLHQEDMDALNIPTLIFLDKQDEFISYKGMRNMIMRNELDRWELLTVTKDADVDQLVKHHLVIDESAVGVQTWEKIRKNIRNHMVE